MVGRPSITCPNAQSVARLEGIGLRGHAFGVPKARNANGRRISSRSAPSSSRSVVGSFVGADEQLLGSAIAG